MNPLFSHRPRKSPPLNRFLEEPIVVDRLSEGLVPSGLAEMAIALQLESTPVVEPVEASIPQSDLDTFRDMVDMAAQDPDGSITIVTTPEDPSADPAPIQYDLESAPVPVVPVEPEPVVAGNPVLTAAQIRGWDPAMKKAELLTVALAKGCEVTELDSKAAIVKALEALTA